MKSLCLYGASWHGREVMQIALDAGLYMGRACFIDDHQSGVIDGFPVMPGSMARETEFLSSYRFLVTIGDNITRIRIGNEIIAQGGEVITLVHPSALVWRYAEIDVGSVIFPRAIVSVAAKVGKFCIVNKHATVGHGAVMEDGANISDSTAMSGRVGMCSFMGLHAVAIPGVDIGSHCTVGAGAAVIRNVPDGATVVGVPARQI